MTESNNLYRQILKSTALFGGVQVFNIIVSILRSKSIAILIGPTGMGIAGLLNVTINVIYSLTSLGLDTSGVKYISQANTQTDKRNVNRTVAILKQLMFYTGVFGSILTIIFASWLSEFTFGNNDFTWSFVWIAITLFFKNISSSHLAILQGFGRLQDLAKANLFGSLFGLLLTVPLYYYFGKDAIVPSIIITAFITMLFAIIFSQKIKLFTGVILKKQLLKEGKGLLNLGVMLSISGLLGTATAYILQIYISKSAGIEVVGFYVAAFTLLNSYVGLIFASMSTDYYPRLSAHSNDETKVKTIVTHQAFIALLIITPLICLFIPLTPLIVKILYSSKFIIITSMITYGIIGMLFRAVSWSMGFILIAKGDSKIFMRTALFFNALSLLMNIVAFDFWGLEGLGISFAAYYFLHLTILKILTFKIYNFYFDSELYKIFIISLILCLSVLGINYFEFSIFKIIVLSILVLVAVIFSIYQLNRKVNLKQVLNKFKK